MTGAEFDSPEARARREAYHNRMCRCGHAMGNHMILTGCILCTSGCSGDPLPETPAAAADSAGQVESEPRKVYVQIPNLQPGEKAPVVNVRPSDRIVLVGGGGGGSGTTSAKGSS